MSVMTEADDLEAVLDELTKYDFVDRTRIFLRGISQGVFFDCGGSAQAEGYSGNDLYCPALAVIKDFEKVELGGR